MAAIAATLALGAVADLLVLRSALVNREPAEGQFRRAYFEAFDGKTGLALDTATHTGMLPTYMLTGDGELGVPPGLVAVAPLPESSRYRIRGHSEDLAPYLVIGSEAPMVAAKDDGASRGEARLIDSKELFVVDGRLALRPWDASRPWSEDARRLKELAAACGPHTGEPIIEVSTEGRRVRVEIGRCSLDRDLAAPEGARLLLAMLAGPDWLSARRQPPWEAAGGVAAPLAAAVLTKNLTLMFGAGLLATATASLLLAAASFFLPTPAMLTWPLLGVAGVATALIRLATIAHRSLSRPWPVFGAVALLLGLAAVLFFGGGRSQPAEPNVRSDLDLSQPLCTVIGYSSVKGEGLRRERGSIREQLDMTCGDCREKTVGMYAGGETLAWARASYCGAGNLGRAGSVTFLGGANDDVLSAALSIPVLVVVSQQGIEPWRRNQASAAAASLDRFATQAAALDGLITCSRERDARFLFLHDFLITDLRDGRNPDRATMLAGRRRVVESRGGIFVDLLERFGAEAGISWFNDYVHPSLLAHQRYAKLACELARQPIEEQDHQR